MMTINREVQAIAKEISLSSLMLKQVGLAVTTPGIAASRRALETAKGIAMQNQTIFTEIKDMAEMSQQRDENGHIRSITIASKAQSWFRKHRVQYLLGQLVSLKLSLSIMLQILQLGKTITEPRCVSPLFPAPDPVPQYENSQANIFYRRDALKKPITQQEMLQERAEIQNMVVVRNWSLVDLQRLYLLAEDEVEHPQNSPSPENRELQQVRGDPRLFITTAAHEENTSNALVKYHETPLSQLEASWDKAMYRPNRLLNAPDNNIVDLLLREWTRLYEMNPKARSANGYQAHVDSDTDDSDSNSEFERVDTRGQYLKAAPRTSGVAKEVRFQARVEDDMDSDEARPRRKGLKRGIIRSGSEDSSSSASDSEDLPASRRSSTSSTTSPRTSISSSSGGIRRQSLAGVYGPPGNPGTPGATRASGPPGLSRTPGPPGPPGNTGMPPGAQPGMPIYPRSGPPSPRMSRPVSVPNQPRAQVSFDQQSQQNSPRYHAPSVGPSHPSVPRNPYQPPPTFSGPGRPGYGGYSLHGRVHHFPQPPPPPSQQQQPPPPPPPNSNSFPPTSHRSSRSESRRSKSRSQKRDRGESGKGSSFKENAKKDVKRGLLGAGAVAGLLDILEGLSAI